MKQYYWLVVAIVFNPFCVIMTEITSVAVISINGADTKAPIDMISLHSIPIHRRMDQFLWCLVIHSSRMVAIHVEMVEISVVVAVIMVLNVM